MPTHSNRTLLIKQGRDVLWPSMVLGCGLSFGIHVLLTQKYQFDGKLFAIPHLILVAAVIAPEIVRSRSLVTPLTLMAGVYSLLVVAPISLSGLYPAENGLTENALIRGSLGHQLYLASIGLTYYCIGGNRILTSRQVNLQSGHLLNKLKVAFMLSFGAWCTCLAMLILVSKVAMLSFIVNPLGQFEESRFSGISWVFVFRNVFYMLFCGVFALYLSIRPSARWAICGMLYTIAYCATAASKSTWFAVPLALVVAKGIVFRRLSVKLAGTVVLLICIGVPLGFAWRDNVRADSLGKTIMTYNEVFNYGSRAMVELAPDDDYLLTAIHDILITPLPRQIWQNKPQEYGLTNRVLMQYMNNTSHLSMVRSFPTMGLAEAWISMGTLGLIVSGSVVGGILFISRRFLSECKSAGRAAFGIALLTNLYLVMRVSIFDTYGWVLLFTYLVARVVIDNGLIGSRWQFWTTYQSEVKVSILTRPNRDGFRSDHS